MYKVNIMSSNGTKLWSAFIRNIILRNVADTNLTNEFLDNILRQYNGYNSNFEYIVFESEEDFLTFKLAWCI